jgi:hypothetical protein
MTVNNQAINRLQELSIDYQLLVHAAVYTMDDVAEILDIPEASQVKTLALRVKGDGDTDIVLCGIRAKGQLDIRKVAQLLNISRSKLQLLNADDIFVELGVPRGAIGLAHAKGRRPSFLSKNLMQSPFLYFGAGSNTQTLKVPTDACIASLSLIPAEIEK